MKKNSYITVTDQFCGAGGSSQGALKAGAEVKMALNHWQLAIDTHQTNFPNTDHDCTDISACDPRRYPSTDILITSPECTNHSLAKGQKAVKKQMDMFAKGMADAAAERSRATMWDVCRFAEFHQYNAIIVENVVDARKWVLFDSWLTAMYALGYQHRCVYLNSMHCHPTPQSRDRMYIVFWKKGNKAPDLDYMPPAHCPKCGKDVNAIQTFKDPQKRFGKYKQQYVYCCPNDGSVVDPYYYAAFNCIDWSDIGVRIGDRPFKKYIDKKSGEVLKFKGKELLPLSPNTLSRVCFGLEKFGKQPLIFHSLYGKEARGVVRSVNTPAFTQTTLPQALCTPFIVKLEHSQRVDNVVSVDQTFSTQTNRQSMMLVNNVRSAHAALQTQTTTQGMGFILPPPLIIENKGQSKARSVTAPAACFTGKVYHGLLTTQAWNSFVQYNRQQMPTAIDKPVQTVATVEQLSITNFQQPELEDCYYRMLKPSEIKLAMAFGEDYIVTGSGKDQVKQLGNAVTPPAMEWLVKQVIESLN